MPYAAPSRCTKTGCVAKATARGRCADHQSSGWVDRRRPQDDRTTRERLGISAAQWQRLSAKVMRDHEGRCHVCGRAGATEIDHKLAVALGGSRTDESNLAPIHPDPCHREKTARELALLRKIKTTRKAI